MYNMLFLKNNLTFKTHPDTEKVPYFEDFPLLAAGNLRRME